MNSKIFFSCSEIMCHEFQPSGIFKALVTYRKALQFYCAQSLPALYHYIEIQVNFASVSETRQQ